MSKAKSSLKIAIAGLGVVGAEVARQLINHGDELNIAAGTKMQLVAVSARDQSVDRGINLNDFDWYDAAPQLAQRDDVDIIGMQDENISSTITGVEMFRKILDRGEAGDNVGLLLRGTKKHDKTAREIIRIANRRCSHREEIQS